MKLLIAYDGSEHARAAIRDLRKSGIPRQAMALVTTVGEPSVSAVGTPSMDPTIARRTGTLMAQTQNEALLSLSQAEELAKEGAVRMAGICPACEVTTHVQLGKPADVIIDTANAWAADLIVVGAQGRSALGRLLIGSVSQHVSTKSARSVLVARHVVERGNNPVRIIVGIDGSPASHAAVEAVATRSWNDNTEIHVVAIADTHRPTTVVNRVPTAAAWIGESNQSQRTAARAALEHSMRVFGSAHLRASEHFIEGAGGAQRILNRHAEEFDADCIFVSGRSVLSDLPLGTAEVINALVTSAPCSVEIVR